VIHTDTERLDLLEEYLFHSNTPDAVALRKQFIGDAASLRAGLDASLDIRERRRQEEYDKWLCGKSR